MVINAGRNNKRLRSEVAAKLKLAATASAPPISASTIPTTSTTTTSSNLVSLNPLTSSFNSLANFCYPQYPQQQLAMSSLQQQFQNMVPYYVHQQQPTVTIANAYEDLNGFNPILVDSGYFGYNSSFRSKEINCRFRLLKNLEFDKKNWPKQR